MLNKFNNLNLSLVIDIEHFIFIELDSNFVGSSGCISTQIAESDKLKGNEKSLEDCSDKKQDYCQCHSDKNEALLKKC